MSCGNLRTKRVEIDKLKVRPQFNGSILSCAAAHFSAISGVVFENGGIFSKSATVLIRWNFFSLTGVVDLFQYNTHSDSDRNG